MSGEGSFHFVGLSVEVSVLSSSGQLDETLRTNELPLGYHGVGQEYYVREMSRQAGCREEVATASAALLSFSPRCL